MMITQTDTSPKITVLPAHEPCKMEIHTKKVLEDMREISAICNITGHRWLLWALLSDLVSLASDVEREMDSNRAAGAKPEERDAALGAAHQKRRGKPHKKATACEKEAQQIQNHR